MGSIICLNEACIVDTLLHCERSLSDCYHCSRHQECQGDLGSGRNGIYNAVVKLFRRSLQDLQNHEGSSSSWCRISFYPFAQLLCRVILFWTGEPFPLFLIFSNSVRIGVQPLCCPRAGPGDRYLQLQQTNEQTLCT